MTLPKFSYYQPFSCFDSYWSHTIAFDSCKGTTFISKSCIISTFFLDRILVLRCIRTRHNFFLIENDDWSYGIHE